MWETPFEESMLELPLGVVIRCQTKKDFEEAGKILTEHGISFARGGGAEDHLDYWDHYKDDTCLYSRPGKDLLYGPTGSTEHESWMHYTECTFYGRDPSPDFSPATDDEIFTLLGGD